MNYCLTFTPLVGTLISGAVTNAGNKHVWEMNTWIEITQLVQLYVYFMTEKMYKTLSVFSPLQEFPDKPDLLRNMMGLIGNVAEVPSLRKFLLEHVEVFM